MMRVILFLLTNLSVMFVFGTVLFFTGVKSNTITALVILSCIIGFSGSIVSLILSKWSSLKAVNGRIIRKPKNDMEKWLLNAIRYQAHGVGIRTPELAIYGNNTINAFASGYSKNNALVALSSGLLKNMNKEDINAVISHEISHIVNGDMVTLSLMQGVVNTFVFFASNLVSRFFKRILFNNRKSNYVRSYGFLLNYVLSIVLQSSFGMLASIMVMAFSRYREYRADADAAKRIGVSKMIMLLTRFGKLTEPHTSAALKTACIRGTSKSFYNLFSSHPTVQDRIHALYKKSYM